jgi:Tol biopolymer transport system component
VTRAELSPDGKTLFFWQPDADEPAEPTLHCLIARRLDTGQEDEIFRVQLRGWGLGTIIGSPDGRWLAFTVRGSRSEPWTVRMVPTTGGRAREVLSTRERENISGPEMGWTPDSRYLLVVRGAGPPEKKTQLWRVPVEGGEPQKVGPPMEGIRFPSVHADGRRISFTAGTPRRTEIWVMENFLPGLQARP